MHLIFSSANKNGFNQSRSRCFALVLLSPNWRIEVQLATICLITLDDLYWSSNTSRDYPRGHVHSIRLHPLPTYLARSFSPKPTKSWAPEAISPVEPGHQWPHPVRCVRETNKPMLHVKHHLPSSSHNHGNEWKLTLFERKLSFGGNIVQWAIIETVGHTVFKVASNSVHNSWRHLRCYSMCISIKLLNSLCNPGTSTCWISMAWNSQRISPF